MSDSIINADATLCLLRERLNEDMLAAAEPMIQQALVDVEKKMRQQLAGNLVALIEARVDFYRNGNNLVIRLDPGKEGERL